MIFKSHLFDVFKPNQIGLVIETLLEGLWYHVVSQVILPEVFWDSQSSARPGHQSVSMTKGYRVHNQLYYVRYHMPGEGSIMQGSRRLQESPNSLQL